MPLHPARNRVIAGAFLLVALAAAVAILVLVGAWSLRRQPMQPLKIHFAAAPNIKVGSSVLLAGHPVGRVDQIGLVEVPGKPGDKHETLYKVEIEAIIPKAYRICQNARIVISQALVGQSAMLNIEDVGYGTQATGALAGFQASPFAGAAEEMGLGPKEQQDLSSILANISDIAATTREDWPKILGNLKTTSENLAEVSGNAKDTVGRINAILDDNRENLKTAIANAKGVTEKADEGAAEILADLKAFAEKLKEIADKNGEDIRATIARARAFMEKTDKDADEIRANVKTTSADLKKAVEDFRVVAADAKALLATNRGNLDATLQNFRDTSDHLRALAKEVRRSPWRLFATPDKEEVESLNLYDTARAFSSAATELENTAEKIETMLAAKQKDVAVDPQNLKEMLKRLETTFENYQKAEEALLKEFERVKK
ncbi:MAG: MlaD family protein [Planctomycetota bacterium]|nr:MlaD family protein [Planctomycetota bacterium]